MSRQTRQPPAARGVSSPVRAAAACALAVLCLLGISAADAASQDPGGAPGVLHADQAVDVETLLRMAEQGDARASFLLGTRYASGRGGVRDDSEAARWFRKAAQQGLAEAQYNLAVMYATGRGVARDMTRALSWYHAAAESGLARAQYDLGTLYSLGRDVPRDDEQAARWLRKAADQGLAAAEYNLGVLYETGRGVRIDAHEAMKWYSKAAAQGFSRASEQLLALRGKLDQGQSPSASRPEAARPGPAPAAAAGNAAGGGGSAAGVVRTAGKSAAPRGSDAADVAVPADGARWLRGLDPGHFTVQIASQASAQGARAFIRRHGLQDRAAEITVRREGVTWHSVFYGDFRSYSAALAAANALPAGVREGKPWIRSVSAVQKSMAE